MNSNSAKWQKSMNDKTFRTPGTGSDGGTEASVYEVPQTQMVWARERALTMRLMEVICDAGNIKHAAVKVKNNCGAGGIDGMPVTELDDWLSKYKQELIERLMQGTYRPQPVRGVQIPKANGGVRQLGIPTVVDRLVQQMILQVLDPILDKYFSQSSYGFRAKRSATDAVKQAQKYVVAGFDIVVDIDLEKFFDRVNHDMLMARLARWIGDKRLLKLVRQLLEAGMMVNGVCMQRGEGTPQGGPLSPLLSNLMLDDLDKELEKRGHKFCRYADDCNIYVGSQTAGERVMTSVSEFLERKLKLKVNREKSAVARVEERKFLGYRIEADGKLVVAPESKRKAMARLRQLTRRNRGRALKAVVGELNRFTIGWVTYFRYVSAQRVGFFQEMDKWLRRRIRSYRLKQRKRSWPKAQFLIQLGIHPRDAWGIAKSSRGWWCVSKNPWVQKAMNKAWFDELGLANLEQRYLKLQLS